MLFGLAHEFQEAPASALRSGMARPARLQKPASSSLRPSSKCWRRCRTRTARMCATEDTFNMDESGLYYGSSQSAGARADCRK
jgi:hypothetical protein